MQAVLDWLESPPLEPLSPLLETPIVATVELHVGRSIPAAVQAAVWRGTELGSSITSVCTTGWESFDTELPGGGWPRRSVSEVLAAQPYVLEWRLLGPALKQVVADGGQVVVVGPARRPHLPGLLHAGIDERQLVWIQAELPAERLWVTEQLIKSNSAGAVVAWLPQARQEQIRRLQVCSTGCEGLVFLCRPESARHEASAAPLRVHAAVGIDWELKVDIFKRRGPVHAGGLVLSSVPGGLSSVLTPRLRKPSRLISRGVPADALGSTVASAPTRRHASIQ